MDTKAGLPLSTRQRILSAGESLFGDVGYHGTRLRDIAGRVGVRKASLFHHFASKDELYRAVVEEGSGEIAETIADVLRGEATPLVKIEALIGAYVDMVVRHPARTRILLRQSLGDAPDGYQPVAGDRLLRAVVDYVAEGQRARVFADVDALALVLGVVGMVVFFVTSAPTLTAEWDVDRREDVERIKRHIALVVRRTLLGGDGAAAVPAAAPRA